MNLKQGQRIEFHIGELNGTGKIVGMSIVEQPIIGGTYIIEPDVSIKKTIPILYYRRFILN